MLPNKHALIALTSVVVLCWASATQASFVFDTETDLALWLKADGGTTLVGGRVDHVITHGNTTVQLPFRMVADKSNTGDTLVRNDGTSGFGAVDYTYQMGEYAVSWDMWNEVAAAAGITLGVGSASTGNQPVNWGRWYAAAQFANWLTTGDKYQGAYTFTFNDDDNPTQITGVTINRDCQNDAGFAYVLPTEDEWYKAAYYKGGGTDAGYWRYPTQQNDSPTGVASGTDPYTAVFGPQSATASVYEAGGRSAYGTMGQGGNVWEWTESGTNNAPNADRWRFGGERAHSNASQLDAISRSGNSRAPDFASVAIGFRIATTARLNEPQRFDFGSALDKYRHDVYRHGVDALANWLVLQGVPTGTVTYEPDAVRISSGSTSPNANSVGLLTDFDNLGNGQKNKFVASITFTMTAGTSSNHSYDKFQLWALGDESLTTGGDGNTGYVVSMARTATWADRRLHLVKGGWDDDDGLNSIYASDGTSWNPVLGDVLTVELHGTYGRQNGVDGLFLDLYAWNETRNEFQEFTGHFDPNPHGGSGFGFGLRTGGTAGNAPTMDVYRFSVIPEPGSWLLLLLGLACGLLLRRRCAI